MPESNNKLYLNRNLQILFGVTMMVVMGVSSIAPVFPSVMQAFGLSATQVAWLVTAFTIPGVVLTPILGILADRFGRKVVLVPSLVCFGVFGTACAFAADFSTLLVFRFLQGVGSAALGALNATIISDLFHENERAQAMGYNAGVLSLGTTLYPLLGGILGLVGWRWPFALPVVALPLAWVVMTRLECPTPARNGVFMDYMRQAAKRARAPKALGLFGTTAVTFMILYGVVVSFLPVYLHETFQASPGGIGAIIAASSLTTALMSSQLGRLARAISMRALLLLAFVLYALSCVMIPMMDDMWSVSIPVLLFGMAQGLNIPTVQTMLAELAPMEQRGAFMALNGTVLRIGQTLGPVVMGGAYLVAGMNGVFGAGALMAVGVCVLVWRLVRD